MSREPNHLEGQSSPYLLQHVFNPVDWYPWGPEALGRARNEDRPIFLSIGYAACHWCHVMERESFEDPAIADFLNAHFVSIKVDREERPDIDDIYMNAVQILSGRGGWPLSVFLTPDLEPFFGGTYFPPEPRHGHPAFLDVLERVQQAWVGSRESLDRSARELAERVRMVGSGLTPPGTGDTAFSAEARRAAVTEMEHRFDPLRGGFGPAPKFPPDQALALLLREYYRSGSETALRMATSTLDAMALGGMYDQVGGGFARYSVDDRWLVPHFEKMLYNQALLVPVYADAWLLTGKPLYRRVVEETLDFVVREMTDPDGGFFSSLDADSEGEEGKFYVWSPDEVVEVLGPEDGHLFCRIYGITGEGNFEGRSIPNLLGGDLGAHAERLGTGEEDLATRLATLRASLLEARERRVRPGTDDKVLTAWNGLQITAFCRAYQVFGRSPDLEAARGAAEFLREESFVDRRLRVTYRGGRSRLNAYLDDYAFLSRAMLDLYETAFDRRDLDLAADLARVILEKFEDRESGGFYFTSDDHETLIARNRSSHDGALPSGTGVAVETLWRLGRHLDDGRFSEAARRALASCAPAVDRAATAFPSLILSCDVVENEGHEVAIVGHEDDPARAVLVSAVHARYLPGRAVAAATPEGIGQDLPLLAGKGPVGGRAAAFVCRDYACREPVTEPEALARLLGD